jgi:hypothetical protein
VVDEDFDIYSNHHEVIENVLDDGLVDPEAPSDALAEPVVGPGRSLPRVIEDRIICLPCAARYIPELAAVVRSYRQLRARRETALNAAH